MDKYKEINFSIGNDIKTAIKELKSHNELVCGLFNGQMLYSDIDDLDSAYIKITEKTKAEFDELERMRQEEYEAKKNRHKVEIPVLTKLWIEKGNMILDKKYRKFWAKCVPNRLRDLYQGMELWCCLEIVDQLNKEESFKNVKLIIENQNHSGMSFSLVCAMVESFCDRGKEFVSFVRGNTF